MLDPVVGPDASQRTGCKLASGYAAVTLFWLQKTLGLPPNARACFLTDYISARLTGRRPVTDWTFAASSGVFDIVTREWDSGALAALGLPLSVWPEVRPPGELLGALTPEMAEHLGLRSGLPVFNGVGDNQASFIGTVAEHRDSVLVNVGTGAQVAAFTDSPVCGDGIEARPFPGGGYLAVSASLCGGRSYATLEGFFRQVAGRLLGGDDRARLFDSMNRLAATVPQGAEGLRCEPFFAGERDREAQRASFTGVSSSNFTPAHVTRALLEGVARTLCNGYTGIIRHRPPARHLVGAGNGLRENPAFTDIVGEEFGMPVRLPLHREEAAYGAALLAAVGAGAQPSLAAAAKLVRFQNAS